MALDTETTGVDSFTDRIVTCSMIYDNGLGQQTERNWLVDPGIEIPEGASAVHGITTEVARRDGMDAATALQQMADSLRAMTQVGIPVVIYNAPFDTTILETEFRRFGVDSRGVTYDRIIDPLVIDKAVDKFRKGSRKLIDTAALYGYDLTNAHAADADNKAAIYVARALGAEFFTDDTTIEELQILQKQWKAEQSASFQSYKRRTDPYAVIDGQWPIREYTLVSTR